MSTETIRIPTEAGVPTEARANTGGRLKERVNRVTTGNAPIVRGTERWMISLLTFVLLFALVMVITHTVTSHRERMALINRPAVVTRVEPSGRTTVMAAETGPLDEQILYAGAKIVRLLMGSDSQNIRRNFAEAETFLTPQMREHFRERLQPEIRRVEESRINVETEVKANDWRLMTKEDFPVDDDGPPVSRYDVLVAGVFRVTYGETGITQPRPFSYHVRLIPTNVTETNPLGLQVADINEWKAPRKAENNANQPMP